MKGAFLYFEVGFSSWPFVACGLWLRSELPFSPGSQGAVS